jgi:hypothetical protein
VVIEGDFSCGNMLEEELCDTPEEFRWGFKEWLYECFTDVINSPKCKIELSGLRTEEE